MQFINALPFLTKQHVWAGMPAQGSSWGAEVHGIDLNKEVPQALQECIKQAVSKHRILVFRDQGIVSGEVRCLAQHPNRCQSKTPHPSPCHPIPWEEWLPTHTLGGVLKSIYYIVEKFRLLAAAAGYRTTFGKLPPLKLLLFCCELAVSS